MYCTSLTDNQVINVLNDEYKRMRNHPEGEIHDGAKTLYHEAREELLRRDIEPSDELVIEDDEEEEESDDEPALRLLPKEGIDRVVFLAAQCNRLR